MTVISTYCGSRWWCSMVIIPNVFHFYNPVPHNRRIFLSSSSNGCLLFFHPTNCLTGVFYQDHAFLEQCHIWWSLSLPFFLPKCFWCLDCILIFFQAPGLLSVGQSFIFLDISLPEASVLFFTSSPSSLPLWACYTAADLGSHLPPGFGPTIYRIPQFLSCFIFC